MTKRRYDALVSEAVKHFEHKFMERGADTSTRETQIVILSYASHSVRMRREGYEFHDLPPFPMSIFVRLYRKIFRGN